MKNNGIKTRKLPLTSKDARALIPQNLCEYASVQKEIVSIGVSTRIEIWAKDKWDEYNDSNVDFDEIAEKMNELGI